VNPSTALATVVVDELVAAGVRHVVLCPGSRSAPFAYAVQAAERAGRLTLHVRVDERSAGFLAVGLGKVTRTPAVVVTTSGTAVANLHPAVLEAHHGVVPLVVLSADRPVELRGSGANQTTVQPGMFGGAPRWSADLPAPQLEGGEGAAAQVAAWRATARDAVAFATGTAGHAAGGGEPGPVHLNVQLREPLVPTEEPRWPDVVPGASAARRLLDEGPVDDAGYAAQPAVPGEGPGRTLVVVGDLPEPGQLERAVAWAASHGWPVVAEPFGPHPRPGVLPHGPLVLTDEAWLAEHAPDRVVTVGRVTLSRPVAGLLRRPGTAVEAVAAHAWIRSRPGVDRVHPMAVLDQPGPGPGAGSAWAKEWRAAGERLAEVVAATPWPWPTGPAVAATVTAALPPGATLFLGSSNAVRDVDLAAAARTAPLRVVANRGLAGIDGCVSTAAGLALAGAHPAYALMGDLTFLHDSGGLLVGPHEPRPDLTVVVVNDDGGGIFTLLEPGSPERAADFERVFGTPTGTDLAALCRAHGARHLRADTAEALATAVRDRPHGVTVVEVAVPRASHRQAHADLRALAARALREASVSDR